MKFFVVGLHCSGKEEIFNILQKQNICCGKFFTNMHINDSRYEVFSDSDINEIFDNKAYIYFGEINDYSRNCFEGISLYEYDNNDVFFLTPAQFVLMKKSVLNEDICIIWLDDNTTVRKQRYKDNDKTYNFGVQEEYEKQFVDEYINLIYSNKKFHILYFTNEDVARVSSIIYACNIYPDLVKIFEKTFK